MPQRSAEKLIHEIDNLDMHAVLDIVANFGSERFGYVVTPLPSEITTGQQATS
jgi:hypothetical protein